MPSAQTTTTPAQANEVVSLSAWQALNRAVVMPTSGNTKLDTALAEVERFTREIVIPAADEHTAAEDAAIAARAMASAEGATEADKRKLKEAERLEAATDKVWIRAYEKRDRMLSKALKTPATTYEEAVIKAEAGVLLYSDLNLTVGQTCDYGLLKTVATQLASDAAGVRTHGETNAALDRAIAAARDYDRDVCDPAWKAFCVAEKAALSAKAIVDAISHPPELVVVSKERDMVSITLTYSDGTAETRPIEPKMVKLLSPGAILAHVNGDADRAAPLLESLETWWASCQEPLAVLKDARKAAAKADLARNRTLARFGVLAQRVLDAPALTPAAAVKKLRAYSTLWEARDGRPENLECDSESEAAMATAFADLERMAGILPGPDNGAQLVDPMSIAAE
jgi:hypothetical protein